MEGDSVIGDTHDIIMTFTPDAMKSVRIFTCTCVHIKRLSVCSFQLLWGTFIILWNKMRSYMYMIKSSLRMCIELKLLFVTMHDTDPTCTYTSTYMLDV